MGDNTVAMYETFKMSTKIKITACHWPENKEIRTQIILEFFSNFYFTFKMAQGWPTGNPWPQGDPPPVPQMQVGQAPIPWPVGHGMPWCQYHFAPPRSARSAYEKPVLLTDPPSDYDVVSDREDYAETVRLRAQRRRRYQDSINENHVS